jgi:hypothetical protein
MKDLPVEDQPSGSGIVPSTTERAIAAMGEPSLESPAWVAFAFYSAATEKPKPDWDTLRNLVTRESLADWGDFSWVPEAIGDRSLATRGYANQEHDWIWYIPLPDPLPDDAGVMMSDGDTLLTGSTQIITLLRQDDGTWRVHGLGDYLAARRTPAGVADATLCR